MRSDHIPLRRNDDRSRAIWLAPVSVMAGSLVTLLPVVATFPWLPPFGLLMLLGWRLYKADALKVWAAAPLGLFDDLVSGQPLGNSTLLWALCFLIIDVLDTRLVWRDYWQDWLIACGGVGFCLIAGRLITTPLEAHVDTALLFQVVVSCALYPLFARFCARLDRGSTRKG